MSKLSFQDIKKKISVNMGMGMGMGIGGKKNSYTYKNIIIGSIVFLVCIIGIYYLYNYLKKNNIIITNFDNQIEVVKRPFLNLYAVTKDGKEVITNIVFITHSFTRDDCETNYNE